MIGLISKLSNVASSTGMELLRSGERERERDRGREGERDNNC